MCLRISEKHHLTGEPLVAKRARRVFKLLEYIGGKSRLWASAFRGHKYAFGREESAELFVVPRWDWIANKTVKDGLHAYTGRAAAYRHAKNWSSGGPRHAAFIAIIPKGAKYYIGTDGDIVSNKLIVTRERVTKAKRK